MNKNLDLKRLGLAFRELWEMNKTILLTIPFIILLLFAFFYFWPDGFFFKKLSHSDVFNSESWYQAIWNENNRNQILLLPAMPIYVFLCTKPFLDKLNRSGRTLLTPISVLERTLALFIFSIGIMLFYLGCFSLFGNIISWFLKLLYLQPLTAYMESTGDIYPSLSADNILNPLPKESSFVVPLALNLFILPLYFLSFVFFRRYSFISFLGMLTGIVVILVVCLHYIPHLPDGISVSGNEGPAFWLFTALAITSWLTISATFYFKIREKEI